MAASESRNYVPAFFESPDHLETKFILTAQVNNILAWNMNQTKKNMLIFKKIEG